MNIKTHFVGVASSIAMLFFLGAHQVRAATIGADVYFTTRSATNPGPATSIDSTLDGFGFLGFLTNVEGVQVDHTSWEFDMSLIGGPVSSAMLDFSFITAAATDTIFLASYSADGIASLSDFLPVGSSALTSFSGTTLPISIDITALVNASLALSHLGFMFSIDSHPSQAFFGQSIDPTSITFTPAIPAPEPATLTLFGLGLAGLGFARRRKQKTA